FCSASSPADLPSFPTRRSSDLVRDSLLEEARRCAGIILGPTATFDFKDAANGEINPSMFFRKRLDLFANIRPNRTYPALPNRIGDRKSTRLNSSHVKNSYAVFC